MAIGILKKMAINTLLRSLMNQPISNHLPQLWNICNSLHSSSILQKVNRRDPFERRSRWLSHNEEVDPPQELWEERRPGWVCHRRVQIKHPLKKMQLFAQMVRGMAVDDAIAKLAHLPKKGAQIAIEVIQEAQELAVKEHNVEYKSNLWIAESLVGKGIYIKGIRRHARCRFGKVNYYFCHYYVRLVEGPPPENFRNLKDGNQKLQEYLEQLRSRQIRG